MEGTLHDAEPLLGLVVVAMCATAIVSKLVLLCRGTHPRFVLVSDTHACGAARIAAECIKCGRNPVTTIFTDCGHSAACPSCAHDIWKAERKCPLCHRPLHGILHIIGHVNVSTVRVEPLVG